MGCTQSKAKEPSSEEGDKVIDQPEEGLKTSGSTSSQKSGQLESKQGSLQKGEAASSSKIEQSPPPPAPMKSQSVTQSKEGAQAETEYQEKFGQKSGQLEQQTPGEQSNPTTPRIDEDPTSFCKSKPDGIYLILTGNDHGTIFAKYSKEFIPDALAFGRPSSFATIADFKYKKPLPVQSRVQSGRSMYFLGWCQWIKEARVTNSEIVLLPQLEDKMAENPNAFPAMRIFLLFGTKVVEMHKGPKGKPINLKHAEAVAIVPEAYTGFDQHLNPKSEMDKTEFLAKAKVPQDKAYLSFT